MFHVTKTFWMLQKPHTNKHYGDNGFNDELKQKNRDSKEQSQNEERRKRRRKIMWFNPLFSLSVKSITG